MLDKDLITSGSRPDGGKRITIVYNTIPLMIEGWVGGIFDKSSWLLGHFALANWLSIFFFLCMHVTIQLLHAGPH